MLALGLALTPWALADEEVLLVHENGYVESRQPGELPPTVTHAWVWTERTAPRRIAAEELGEEPLPEDRQQLAITVSRRGKAPLAVRAAPVDMWTEVPEPLLPIWELPQDGALRIPRDARRPWRLRLVGEGVGGWWTDVGSGRGVVSLAPAAADDRGITLMESTGEAIPGAGLTLLDGAAGRGATPVLAQFRAGEDGAVTIPSLPDGREITLIASAPGHASAALVSRSGSLPSRLRLPPGTTLRGRFVDSEKAPLAAVAVRAEAYVAEGIPALAARRVESGEDGRWEVAALPRGEVAVLAAAQGLAPFRTVVDAERPDVDLGTVVLRPGARLPVLVVDDTGAPVAAAAVTAGAGTSAVTDHRGQAVLEPLPAQTRIELTTRADGHLAAVEAVPPPFPEQLRVTLERAFVVQGRLVDARGVPAAGGTVRIENGSSYRDETLLPGGEFELELLPGQPVGLVLRSPVTTELRLAVESGQPGELRQLGDLSAPPGIRAHGRIVRADGSPVAGARIWCPRPSEQGDVVAWVHRDFIEGRSAHDGSFELAGLPERPALLRFDAPGLARLHRLLQPERDAAVADLGELVMGEGATVRVFTHEAVGGGALARVDLRGGWLEPDMLTAAVSDGEAVVRHVPAGEVTITVLEGRDLLCEQVLQVGEGDRDLEVECGRSPMRVSGTVVVGAAAAGVGQLLWHPEGVTEVPGIIMNRESAGGLRQQSAFGAGRPQVDIEVDDSGFFATEKLRPGAWKVAWVPAAGSMSEWKPVELPASDHHDLTLTFSELYLLGRVVDSEENPVAGARVRALDGGSLVMTDGDGSFSLTGLSPGRHGVHARLGERTSQVAEAMVEPGRQPEPVLLVLEERLEDKVEVRVVDREERPAAGAFVFLEDERGVLRLLTADRQGRARTTLRPPYPQHLRAAAVHAGEWTFGDWLSRDDAAKDGLTLASEPTGALLISSEDLAGSPQLFTALGWDLSQLLTRIGTRPLIRPDLPLHLEGLPNGEYTVNLKGSRNLAAVHDGERAALELR